MGSIPNHLIPRLNRLEIDPKVSLGTRNQVAIGIPLLLAQQDEF